MKFRKRQLILTALIVSLGVAVYLNWRYSDDKNFTYSDVLQTSKELGEARYVNNSKIEQNDKNITENSETQGQSEEDVTNDANDENNYFSQANINRQKARDEAISVIKNTISDPKASEQTKSEVTNRLAEISKNIQLESNIENLIKAKGYSDCLAFIQNGECNIVVSPNCLNESSAATIFDIVTGQSGITGDKIKIIEAK